MIQDKEFIKATGKNHNERDFDNLEEYFIFSIIDAMTQKGSGYYEKGIDYLAEWTYSSRSVIKRRLADLKTKGYIEEEFRNGATSKYRSVPIEKVVKKEPQTRFKMNHPHLVQNEPRFKLTHPPVQIEPPIIKHKENINSSSSLERARELVRKWWYEDIDRANLTLYRAGRIKESITEEQMHGLIDAELDDFAERIYCEGVNIEVKGRMDTIKHLVNLFNKSKQDGSDTGDNKLGSSSKRRGNSERDLSIRD